MKISIKNFPNEIYIKLKEDYKTGLFNELSKTKNS